MRTVVAVVGVLALAGVGACGGGDGGGDDDAGAAGGEATTTTADETSDGGDRASDAGAELPAFLADYERVCTTQVGFAGAAAYEPAPGVHPVVLFEDYRGEGFVQSGRSLPAGWAVEEDTNFKDTSDLAEAQLVACADRTDLTPTGKRCTFEPSKDAKGDDAKPTELELVDATFELTVYEARTGVVKATSTLHARDDDCPYFATFKKGDTTYVATPDDDDYTNALKALVTGTGS